MSLQSTRSLQRKEREARALRENLKRRNIQRRLKEAAEEPSPLPSLTTLRGTYEPFLTLIEKLLFNTALPTFTGLDVAHLSPVSCLAENLLTGGKRIRPLTTALMAEAVGLSPHTPEVMSLATGVELLHLATLLHDDVVDNSTERRGHLAAHIQFSNRTAILTGDYWLARALDLLLETGNIHIPPLLAKAVRDLTQGELLGLSHGPLYPKTALDYEAFVALKTVPLFELIARGIEALSGTPPGPLSQFSRALGILFQYQDDLLDYLGGQELGKPRGQDFQAGKRTFAVHLSLFHDQTQEAFWTTSLTSPTLFSLEKAIDLVRNGLPALPNLLSPLQNQARHALASFPSPAKNHLEALLDYATERCY